MDYLKKMALSDRQNLFDIAQQKPLMLVFLRHFGCVFCQQSLHDIANIQEEIRQKKMALVFVHMATDEVAIPFIEKFKIEKPYIVSDPQGDHYRYFGLEMGSVSQLYGLGTFFKGIKLTMEGYKLQLDKKLGDIRQMPGIFILFNGNVIKKFIHQTPDERPNYLELIQAIPTTA